MEFGHKVTVINNCPKNEKISNINWLNINNLTQKSFFDLAISNNDCCLFDKVNTKKKILLSHDIEIDENFVILKNNFLVILNINRKLLYWENIILKKDLLLPDFLDIFFCLMVLIKFS